MMNWIKLSYGGVIMKKRFNFTTSLLYVTIATTLSLNIVMVAKSIPWIF